MHYYQRDLAFIHDRGYGLHADRCAPGILGLLAGVGDLGDGLVLEFGCGSGALTRHLLAAGLRVVATDASADMLALARARLGPDAGTGTYEHTSDYHRHFREGETAFPPGLKAGISRPRS